MIPSIQLRIADLQAKASRISAAVEFCNGHLFWRDHISKISAAGDSARCVRCGERRAVNEIREWEWAHFAPAE